jgi:hypothetical protein
MTVVPPLLMLAEGRKPRPRKAPMNRPKESVLHFAVAKLLREHCLPDWLWTHIASGELRDVRTAAKLKAMGVRRGWPDFILVPPIGQLHSLELKRAGEVLSDDQEAFQLHCIRHGWPHVVARTLDEALVALDAWGCLRI